MPEVHLLGTIQSGSGFGVKSAYVRWRILCGPEWTLLGGLHQGHSQVAKTEEAEDSVAFEHPLDAHYSCTSLVGWPKLLVSVWQQDEYGRHEIAGYGTAFIPMGPGTHAIEIATWRPAGSALQEIAAWFRGGLPQLTDTSIVVDTSRRHLLSTVSMGDVRVEVQVLCKGFSEFGVEFDSTLAASSAPAR